MNQPWDAETYSKDFSFVGEYGANLVDLIDLDGAETALDLGCGAGALTQSLVDRGLRTIGIDGSPEMVAKAKADHPELEFTCADARDFTLSSPVDVVFSNAVLHWIDADDQLSMLRCVHQALKPGGQFVFEMGGKGNNDLIHDALAREFARAGYGYRKPFYFPSIAEYATLLEHVGLTPVYAWLFDRPTPFPSEDGLAEWLAMFVTTPFREVEVHDRERIVESVVRSLRPVLYRDGVWYLDYVRLRMKAVKPERSKLPSLEFLP